MANLLPNELTNRKEKSTAATMAKREASGRLRNVGVRGYAMHFSESRKYRRRRAEGFIPAS